MRLNTKLFSLLIAGDGNAFKIRVGSVQSRTWWKGARSPDCLKGRDGDGDMMVMMM